MPQCHHDSMIDVKVLFSVKYIKFIMKLLYDELQIKYFKKMIKYVKMNEFKRKHI